MVFKHSLFLYQKSHVNNSCEIIPYARTFHEVFYIFWMAKIYGVFWETFLKQTIVN